MKKQLLLLLCLTLSLMGCEKIDNEPMTLEILSGNSYRVDNKEQLVKIAINSSGEWELTGCPTWCLPDKTTGNGSETLVFTITANTSSEMRSVTLVIRNRDVRRTIKITQMNVSSEHVYKLPVIFHILYNDPTNREQNVEAAWLYQILNQVNAFYSDSIKSQNMGVEFIPATHDPKGNLLAEAGINRILWPTSIQMDCDAFTKDPNNIQYIWDLNQYINVMIYAFTNQDVLGVSYLPYTTGTNGLAGLLNGDRYFVDPTLYYPHCLCINNEYLQTIHLALQVPDATITLSHELGHYLGLFHVFDEGLDNDYCDDTPSYDRGAYDAWLRTLTTAPPFEELAQRTSIAGTTFTSDNIMDYDFSYLNRFTPNQRQRLRHVLENSPLIPGPTNVDSRTRSMFNMEIPEARTIK